jgi:hypothetical protein
MDSARATARNRFVEAAERKLMFLREIYLVMADLSEAVTLPRNLSERANLDDGVNGVTTCWRAVMGRTAMERSSRHGRAPVQISTHVLRHVTSGRTLPHAARLTARRLQA